MTTALAAACFVKAFGIRFLALPRSRGAADAHESPALMLVPQALLAALCVALGLFPGVVLGALGRVTASLPGLQRRPRSLAAASGWRRAPGRSTRSSPARPRRRAPRRTGVAAVGLAARRARHRVARAPTWGCGGELSGRNEYTATAFSKPLDDDLPRRLPADADRSRRSRRSRRIFRRRCVTASEIEPTFERYVYGPLVRGVLRVAERMKVLQAGSLHAYLALRARAARRGAAVWLGGTA